MAAQHARTTLAERLDPRHNSINAIRLVLACIVLLSHSIQLSSGGGDVLGRWTGSDLDLSTMAVDGFFALSGFLIVGSYLSSRSVWRYLWRRALRILPGFWTCLLVTAFVIGPLTALLAAGSLEAYPWSGPRSALSYVRDNFLLLIRQFEIAGSYGGLPVNGSLHTLFYEFVCYLLVAAAGIVGLYRLRSSRPGLSVITGLWVLGLFAIIAVPALITDHPARELLVRHGSMFFCGGLAYFLAGHIRVSAAGCLVASGVLVVAIASSPLLDPERGLMTYTLLAAPAISYLILALGASTRLAHVGATRDLSYGLYVYAWPVQATLLVLDAADWWVPVFVGVSLLLSLGLAYLSWTWVEAPALRLKSWSPRRRLDQTPPSTSPSLSGKT